MSHLLVSCVTQVGDSLAVDLPHDTHNHVAAAEIEQDLRHPEATPGCGDGQGKACTCATVLHAETRLTCWCGGRMHMKHGGSCSKSCSKTVAARKVMRLFRPMKTGRRCVCARACVCGCVALSGFVPVPGCVCFPGCMRACTRVLMIVPQPGVERRAPTDNVLVSVAQSIDQTLHRCEGLGQDVGWPEM